MTEAPAFGMRATALGPPRRDERRHPSLRVLLAADGSGSARVAEEWIVRLRWASRPRIDVLCVARGRRLGSRLSLQTYRPAVRSAVDALDQADVMTALRLANAVAERLQSERFRTRTWACRGDPVAEISAMARSEKSDLLVIGSRGRRGWFSPPDLVARLLARVDAAVLVTRATEDSEGSLPRRVGVVADTDESEEHLAWASTAGWLADADVTPLAVGIPSGAAVEHGPDLAVLGRQNGSRAADAVRDALESTAAVLVPPRAARYDASEELGT